MDHPFASIVSMYKSQLFLDIQTLKPLQWLAVCSLLQVKYCWKSLLSLWKT